MHEEKKEYLQNVRLLYKLICSYEEELLEHRLITGCAPIGCYEQIVHGTDQRANSIEPAVIKILEYEELIKETIAKYIDTKAKCLEAIEKIPDVTEKAVLRFRYINGKSHDETAKIIGYSTEQEKRICNSALEKFVIPES
jgi:DNA-directed RNA polymerase specialized sigma subunit